MKPLDYQQDKNSKIKNKFIGVDDFMSFKHCFLVYEDVLHYLTSYNTASIGIPDGSQQDIKVNKVEHLFDGFQIEYLYIKHIYIIHMLCNLLSCGMMVLYVDVDVDI